MSEHAEKDRTTKSPSTMDWASKSTNSNPSGFTIPDNRPETIAQKSLQKMADNSPQAKQAAQLKSLIGNTTDIAQLKHEKGCGCSNCRSTSGVTQRAKNDAHAHQSTANVQVSVNTQGNATTPAVAQLTTANLSVNSKNRGNGEAGLGEGPGGVNHAEQKAWNAALSNINAAFADEKTHVVNIKFEVDQTICPLCQNWFENVAYTYLSNRSVAKSNKPFSLIVEVDGHQVTVLGENETNWPKTVGDEERFSIVEQLKKMLITWGGLGEQAIWTLHDDGEKERHDAWDLDQTIRTYETEIRKSNKLYSKFLETGMLLTGNRKDINFEEFEEERRTTGY